jgi:hypothetical protein
MEQEHFVIVCQYYSAIVLHIFYLLINPVFIIQSCRYYQARSSLYANTQLRAHRRDEKKIKSKKKNKE